MAESDGEKQRRSNRLFGSVIALHGVVMLAIPIALLTFLDMKVEGGGRALGQVLYVIGLLGVIFLIIGWRKFNGQADGRPDGGANTDGGAGSSGTSDGDSGDGGGE